MAYGKRYYDPTKARFLSVDPISDQFPFVSTFNYAENSPITNIDLHGLQKISYTATGPNFEVKAARSYKIPQTGTGYGLSVNPNYIVSSYTDDLQMAAGVGIGGPLLAAAGVPAMLSGVSASFSSMLSAVKGSFSAQNLGMKVGGDILGQTAFNLSQGSETVFQDINVVSVIASGITNSYVGAAAGGFITYTVDGDFSTNTLEGGAITTVVGGLFGKLAGDFSGDLAQRFTIAGSGKLLSKGFTLTNPIATMVGTGAEAASQIPAKVANELSKPTNE